MNDLMKIYIENDIQFSIVVIEDESNSIYSDLELKKVVGYLKQINNKIVNILKVEREDFKLYGLVEYRGEIIGWINIENSYIVNAINNKSVKVLMDDFEVVPKNKEMKQKTDFNLLFSNGVFTAKHMYIEDGNKIYALYKKRTFMGFVYEKDLDFAINIETYENINITTDICYKDSNLKEKFGQFKDFSGEKIKIEQLYPKSRLVKFRHQKKTYWTESKHLNNLDLDLLIKSNKQNNYKDSQINELVENLIGVLNTEKSSSKIIIQKLIKENISLYEKNQKLEQRKERIEILYKNLSNSKLGRIQKKIWSRRRH